MLAAILDPTSLPALQLFNTGGYLMPVPDGVLGFNTRAAHTAETGSVGAMTNGEYLPVCMRLSPMENPEGCYPGEPGQPGAHGNGLLSKQPGYDDAGPHPLVARLCQVSRQPASTGRHRER